MNTNKKWSNVDVAKILVSIIMPILLFGLGYYSNRISEERKALRNDFKEYMQGALKHNNRIYDMRLNLYSEIKIQLNEIFCYIYYVGKWKELSPERILLNKRYCDELMYSSQSFFSPEFFQSYEEFMTSAFQMFNGAGDDAKIKSDLNSHKKYSRIAWHEKYDDMFISQGRNYDDVTIRKGIRKAYNEMMTNLSREINIEERQVTTEYHDYKPTSS